MNVELKIKECKKLLEIFENYSHVLDLCKNENENIKSGDFSYATKEMSPKPGEKEAAKYQIEHVFSIQIKDPNSETEKTYYFNQVRCYLNLNEEENNIKIMVRQGHVKEELTINLKDYKLTVSDTDGSSELNKLKECIHIKLKEIREKTEEFSEELNTKNSLSRLTNFCDLMGKQ